MSINKEASEEERKNQLLENGSFGRVHLKPCKPCYLELFEEFPQLGKFFLMDNNKIKAVGFVCRLDFTPNKELKI